MLIALSGAHVVLPDRVLSPGTVVIEGDRIAEIRSAPSTTDVVHHCIVPGFVDVHVHGVEGTDALDDREGPNPVAAMAATLPRYGVTAFCPTTIACAPDALARVLRHVRQARTSPAPRTAAVLPAHLESNFISPAFRGAQPLACLRTPRAALDRIRERDGGFAGFELLAEIERAGNDVGIVTVAPELDGAMDLIRWLTAHGHRVSLGHSGADFDQGIEAIRAGARQATHLFNRMTPLGHRAPGLAGAVLTSGEVSAEVICDGYHVHPALVRMTVGAKHASRVMAITDGTALSGLGVGARGLLGGQPIVAGESAAFLADGTMAGSTLTMERAFGLLVRQMGLSLVQASALCSGTPARELGLRRRGALMADAIADLVLLDDTLSVVTTYIAGQVAYER